jgi:hypothetical protein
MELEQIKEFLATDEGKGIVAELAKGMGFESPDDVTGLRNKNRELLGKNKEYKQKADKFADTFGELDDDTLSEVKDYIANPAKRGKSDEVAKWQREAAAEKAKSSKLEQDYNKSKELLSRKAISSKLFESFNAANIDPIHQPLLKDAFGSKLKVEWDEDGTESVIYDDGKYGRPFDEYMTEWVKSTGQPYIKQPTNSGAKTTGVGTKNQSNTYKRADLQDEKIRAEYSKRLKSGEDVSIIQ